MKTKTRHWTDALTHLGACPEAVRWAARFDTLDAAWAACKRGDWMLWLAGRLSGKPGGDGRRALVLACCECARLVLKHVPDGEARPRIAIETAEAWARGEHDDLARVSAAACDAAYAAYAAYAAANAADDAAYAASACATRAADDHAATLRRCADIVRRHYPTPPRLEEVAA